jgi:ubiquinone/menaquinone biosynthesis C-methylase UbiE
LRLVIDAALFPAPPATVADVGCGHGAMVESLVAHGWRTLAVDESHHLVKAVRDRCHGRAIGCVADAQALPFRPGGLDGVVAMEVMEHLEAPDALAREMVRVTRPGGAVLVAVPTAYTEAVYRRLNPRYWVTTTHRQLFSRRRLRATLERAGLQVVQLRSHSFEWSLRWFVHAVLRSNFDFTGTIQDHVGLQRWFDRIFRALNRFALTRVALGAAGRVVGKSYYAYARRA